MNIFIRIATLFLDREVLATASKILRLKPQQLYDLMLKKPKQFAKQFSKLPKAQQAKLAEVLNNLTPTEMFNKIKKQKESYIQKFKSEFMTNDLVKAFKDVDSFADFLGKIGKEGRKKFADELANENKANEQMANLSSSWLVKGKWTPTQTGNVGDLTLWIKGAKHIYTYPGVSIQTWTAMRRATGANGNGAGSVFWALYLRQFKGSSLGQYISKLQKLSGVVKKIGV